MALTYLPSAEINIIILRKKCFTQKTLFSALVTAKNKICCTKYYLDHFDTFFCSKYIFWKERTVKMPKKTVHLTAAAYYVISGPTYLPSAATKYHNCVMIALTYLPSAEYYVILECSLTSDPTRIPSSSSSSPDEKVYIIKLSNVVITSEFWRQNETKMTEKVDWTAKGMAPIAPWIERWGRRKVRMRKRKVPAPMPPTVLRIQELKIHIKFHILLWKLIFFQKQF